MKKPGERVYELLRELYPEIHADLLKKANAIHDILKESVKHRGVRTARAGWFGKGGGMMFLKKLLMPRWATDGYNIVPKPDDYVADEKQLAEWYGTINQLAKHNYMKIYNPDNRRPNNISSAARYWLWFVDNDMIVRDFGYLPYVSDDLEDNNQRWEQFVRDQRIETIPHAATD